MNYEDPSLIPFNEDLEAKARNLVDEIDGVAATIAGAAIPGQRPRALERSAVDYLEHSLWVLKRGDPEKLQPFLVNAASTECPPSHEDAVNVQAWLIAKRFHPAIREHIERVAIVLLAEAVSRAHGIDTATRETDTV